MDWAGWAVFGVLATVLLTAVLIMAQLGGLTRRDLPLMLGTLFVPDPDRARVVGFFIHLANRQVFALVYAAAFTLLGRAGPALGAAFGLLHAAVALTILVPLLPGFTLAWPPSAPDRRPWARSWNRQGCSDATTVARRPS
jgi:hypothetical protein